MTEFVAVTNQRHAESESCQSSKEPDNCSLAKKNPDDLCDVCAERFHDSDLTPLLHGHGDECAHDSEGRDDHDEEQQEKHHRALEPHGFEILVVHVDPGLRVFGRLEKLFDCLFHPLSAVGIVGLDRDAVERVAQSV